MSGFRTVVPGAGEVIGDAPDRRVEILSDADPLHATWSRFAAGRDGADLHVHRGHTDCFYVLAGELSLRLGVADRAVALPAGTLALIPPLVVHGFRNASAAEVRYLNLHAPGRGFASFLRGLRDGRPVTYDQWDPPDADPRPPGDAVIGRAGVLVDEPGRRVTLLADVADVRVEEAWSARGSIGTAGPRGADALRSLHVLEGAVAVRVQGGTKVAGIVGTWIQVPAGLAHEAEVAGDGPARVLDVRTPGRPPGP